MWWAVNTRKSVSAGENTETMEARTLEAGQAEMRKTNPLWLAKDKMYQGNDFY